MKNFLAVLFAFLFSLTSAAKMIRISTDKTDLILKVSLEGRLYQVYLGERLLHARDLDHLSWTVYAGSDGSYPQRGYEVYEGSGDESFFEPALAVTHSDGNSSTYLYYKSSEQHAVAGGTETVIHLFDNRYPVNVTLYYVAYAKENVIKVWSEIEHHEKHDIVLWRYNSTMLYFNAPRYFLTSYHGDWAREGQPATEQLQPGKKILDTKLGARAAMQTEPFFELGLNETPQENQGTVMLGTIGWTGNFRCTFEVDNAGVLRILPGINPYASDYQLKAGQIFKTPEFIFTFSDRGTGEASRNLQDWARRYQLKDGMGDRMTLLNNWESTGYNFNEQDLARLMKEGKDLGVDLFLLDDGWFGNKYPRKNDHAGLGDWKPTVAKLPNGICGLTEVARKAGVKFGLWVEPEMVNPKSELFKKHPDWVIHLPNRETYYYRHQLVLDLSNPKVQNYVYDVIDGIMTKSPGVAYLKWDCNSPITNIYSPYLKKEQGHLYIDYVRGLYCILQRITKKYPKLSMMLCSGGGARCDYEALKYFTAFWCSDNTDPFERLYIQWSMSKFFPAKAMAAHVTDWNAKTSVKFRVDVASMCKLGFDIDLKTMGRDDYKLCQESLRNYNKLKPVILDGEQYRLVSPYESHHMAVDYVSQDKRRAVLFAYDLHPRFKEILYPVLLKGLDPNATYEMKEINLAAGKTAISQIYSGDYLMKVGVSVFSTSDGTSHVFELVKK